MPILKTQLLQPHFTQSKHNKDTPTIQKVRPSCIPVPKDKKCIPVIKDSHLNQPKDLQTSNSPTAPSNQITKQQSILPMQQTTLATTQPSRQGKHPFYQCHLHQPEKQLLQDHHHTTTANTITNSAFQDHLEQQTTINTCHYCHPHCTSTPCQETRYQHLQDDTHMHKDG